jgi:hypothetical protein
MFHLKTGYLLAWFAEFGLFIASHDVRHRCVLGIGRGPLALNNDDLGPIEPSRKAINAPTGFD